MGPKLEASLRELTTSLREKIRALHPSDVVAQGGSLLQEFRDSERFRSLLDPDGRLADRILYPDPALCKPIALQFTNADTGAGFRFEVATTAWPVIHEFIALLAGDEGLLEDDLKASAGYWELQRTLVPQLAVRDMVVRADSNRILYQASTRSEWSSSAITWLGHNTTIV